MDSSNAIDCKFIRILVMDEPCYFCTCRVLVSGCNTSYFLHLSPVCSLCENESHVTNRRRSDGTLVIDGRHGICGHVSMVSSYGTVSQSDFYICRVLVMDQTVLFLHYCQGKQVME